MKILIIVAKIKSWKSFIVFKLIQLTYELLLLSELQVRSKYNKLLCIILFQICYDLNDFFFL